MVRIKSIKKLRFGEMIANFSEYVGLAEGLIELPIRAYIRIDRKKLRVPENVEQLMDNICYGQRLFLVRPEENDFGSIFRIMDGYFYPLFTKSEWNEDKALLFGKKILNCKVKDLYPIAMHIMSLVSEMATREEKLLHREPSKLELAAGIERLNIFAELSALDFLAEKLKISLTGALLTPYKECLARFYQEKETQEFQKRYTDLYTEVHLKKNKKSKAHQDDNGKA